MLNAVPYMFVMLRNADHADRPSAEVESVQT